MQDIDTKTFIKRYDKLLLLVAEGLPTLGSQVMKAIDSRPSVLEGYAILSNFASHVFAATAMAEQYITRSLWTTSPDRPQIDEWNFGMILYFINNHTMQEQMPEVWQALLLKAEALKHPEPIVQNLETRFVDKVVSINEITNFPQSFNQMIEELVAALCEIFISTHPDFPEGGGVRAAVTGENIGYTFAQGSCELILQQSDVLGRFGQHVEELRQYGIWQFVSSYLLTQCCEIEVAIEAMRHPNETISPEVLQEAAESLSDDPLKELNDALNSLDKEYLDVCNTPEYEDFVAAIRRSSFPLTIDKYRTSFVATGPANSILRITIGSYRDLAELFVKELKRLIKEVQQ